MGCLVVHVTRWLEVRCVTTLANLQARSFLCGSWLNLLRLVQQLLASGWKIAVKEIAAGSTNGAKVL